MNQKSVLKICEIADDLTCFVDPNAPFPSNAHSWLARGGSVSYLINAGWNEQTQVPPEYKEQIRTAIKISTHFHYDSIQQWSIIKNNVWLSKKQAAAQNCDDQGFACTPAVRGDICAPSTWLTFKPVAPFPFEDIYDDSETNLGEPASSVIAIPCSGHSQTDQAFLHRPSRTLFTGDIFYIGQVFYFFPDGSLLKAIQTLKRFLDRDDWDFAAQPHWDYATRPDPQGEDFRVPRKVVEEFYNDLLEIKAGNISGHRSNIEWWSEPIFLYQVSSGSVTMPILGHPVKD